ncbi:MAG: hypothetical protein NT154_02335 [Verrucomicrobia bacterium]|nr:hypothetical protein [Verrucomicrobiota bacterium]
MTKVIAALLIIAAIYGGWELFLYWEKVKNDEETKKQQDTAAMTSGDKLPGVPYQLEASLLAARSRGAAALRTWLKTNDRSIEDPRKAWIELDFCIAVAREDPAEAKRVFAGVKERIGPSSPVWQRMKQLQNTYE